MVWCPSPRDSGAELVIGVRNTDARRHPRRQTGRRWLGLVNIERRLELHYGDAGTTTAMLRLPAQDRPEWHPGG